MKTDEPNFISKEKHYRERKKERTKVRTNPSNLWTQYLTNMPSLLDKEERAANKSQTFFIRCAYHSSTGETILRRLINYISGLNTWVDLLMLLGVIALRMEEGTYKHRMGKTKK